MRLPALGNSLNAPLSHDAYLRLKYFAGLNGMRCFAVVGVIWHHARRPGGIALLERGHMGVDLFFVLSGFLISTLLIRERAARGRISLSSFWVRRIVRLFPAYYALLAAMGLIYLLFKRGDPDVARFFAGAPIYAAYLSNWVDPGVNNLSHSWTLATEEQFYLVWPMVEAIGRPFIMAAAWIAALVANQLMNFGIFDESLRHWGVMGVARREIVEVTYTPILLGVALAHLLHRPAGYAKIALLVGWRGAAPVFIGLFIATLAIGLPTLDGLPRLALHLLICLLFAAILVRPASRTVRFLETRPLRYLGTISYGMYLYHMLCLAAVWMVVGDRIPPVVFPAGLALTVAVAGVSYAFFEKPFLALGSRFRPVPIIRDPMAGEAVAPAAIPATAIERDTNVQTGGLP